MRLLVATRNAHKLEEIRAIFSMSDLKLCSAADFPELPEVVEDGDTFEANSIKKAVTMAKASGIWTMADDSGLEVDVLNGQPGVHSARYAGEPVSYEANNRKLLAELGNEKNRAARFRCVIALSDPDGNVKTVEGKCEGAIAHSERGAGGFGYDPLFVPEGHEQTFSEMDPAAKNAISHRGVALARAAKEWRNTLEGDL